MIFPAINEIKADLSKFKGIDVDKFWMAFLEFQRQFRDGGTPEGNFTIVLKLDRIITIEINDLNIDDAKELSDVLDDYKNIELGIFCDYYLNFCDIFTQNSCDEFNVFSGSMSNWRYTTRIVNKDIYQSLIYILYYALIESQNIE